MKLGLSLGLSAYRGGAPFLANIIENGDFASAGPPPILDADWSISAGVLTKIAGAASRQARWTTFLEPLVIGATYRVTGTVSGYTGGSINVRFNGGTSVVSSNINANGAFSRDLLTVTGNNEFAILANNIGALSVDNVVVTRIA